jgi:hypothetical protein
VITDEYLLSVVPPTMASAQEGPAAWEAARALLIAAFDDQERSSHHYRAAVIAHYVGFLSISDPADQLRWHQAALAHAELAEPLDVAGFMPSLLASVGGSYANLGERAAALDWYQQAAGRLDELKDDDYGLRLRQQILGRLSELAIES